MRNGFSSSFVRVSSRVGTIFADLASLASTSSRGSGTATSPTCASVVLNGYFVACAAAVSVSALKSADLPTFGRPTMPQVNPIVVLSASSDGGDNLGWRDSKGIDDRQRPNSSLVLQVFRQEHLTAGKAC